MVGGKGMPICLNSGTLSPMPEPENQPAVGKPVDVGGLPGEQIGAAVVDAIDQRAELDRFRRRPRAR